MEVKCHFCSRKFSRSRDFDSPFNGAKRPAPSAMRPKPYALVKRPVMKPQLQRPRPEVKTSTGEGSVAKVAVKKTPAVNTKRVVNPVTVSKQETKKPEPIQEAQKEVKPQLPTEKVCSGHYELNTLMTRMVDVELQDVMNKVMQELPDASANDTESMVVDTLKEKAGEVLKNIIGLNITKRLLNVFNPLGVKVKFNGKPEKEELREFLKKYNFTAFARKAVNIFAAQVKSIDDFDRICSEDDVRCGSVKVTVTPVYRFATCPPNLKTNYNDIDFDDLESESIDEDVEMKDIESKKVETPKVVNKSPKNDGTQVKEEKINTQATSQTKPNISPKKNLESNKSTEVTNNPEPPKAIKTEEILETKSGNKITLKSTNATTPVKTEVTNSNTEIKVTPTKPVTKVSPTKPVSKVSPIKPVSKASPTKPVTKVSPTKPVTKVSPTKPVTKVTPTKPINKLTPNKTTKVSPTKHVTKITTQKSTNAAKKSTKVNNDYDELDDHDILALMSEGIVLDECSGSDEE